MLVVLKLNFNKIIHGKTHILWQLYSIITFTINSHEAGKSYFKQIPQILCTKHVSIYLIMYVCVLHFIWYCIYVLILIDSFLKTIFEKLYYKKIKEHRETEGNVRTRKSIFFLGFK